VLSIMKEREPRYRNVREKMERSAERAAARAEILSPVEAAAGAGTSAAPVRSGSTVAGPSRARAGSKKAKRRRQR
jgi:hypothetical protein